MTRRDNEQMTQSLDADGRVGWDRPALLNGTSRGVMPWTPRRWSWVLSLLLIPLLAAGTIWGVRTIERQVEDAAEQMLSDSGITTDTLTFDAEYRNIVVGGVIGPGSDALELERILEDTKGRNGEDIRQARILATMAPPEVLGAISVDAVSNDGETLELRGTVPSQVQKDEILNTAATTGLTIVDDLTASGLRPSASDADAQIKKFSSAIGGLTLGSFSRAELFIDDEGSVQGSIDAVDAASAELLDAVSGDGVSVTAPPEFGALDISATYDGVRVILNGTVFTNTQSIELVEASSTVVGAANVVNNLAITDLAEAIPRSGVRVTALASVISTFDGLVKADAMINDTDITVNGEAPDSDSQAATATAVAATGAANLRPGGEIRIVPPEEPDATLQEEIDLLQAELDALQDEIRETVVFEVDSNELNADAQATLDKVVDAMNRYAGPVIEIGGHTDSGGDVDYNVDLSQRRADAVVAYIASVGIDGERLRPVGFGESQPLEDNGTDDGRLQNRRVEFIAKESF